MEFVELGGTGEKIPALGLGTYGMGGGFRQDRSRDDESVEAIRAALEMGYTLIDTAEAYGNGHSEELVGEAIEPFERDELFIVSKVSPDHSHFTQLVRAAKGSVERLGTHMDLYLMHMPPRAPLRETVLGLEKVVDMGLARYVGVSNFDAELTRRAVGLAGNRPIVANQSEHSLLEPRLPLLEACRRMGVTFMAYSPLGWGELFDHPLFPKLEASAREMGRTAVQSALRWVIESGAVALVKSENPSHLEENLGALGWELGDKWGELKNIFISAEDH